MFISIPVLILLFLYCICLIVKALYSSHGSSSSTFNYLKVLATVAGNHINQDLDKRGKRVSCFAYWIRRVDKKENEDIGAGRHRSTREDRGGRASVEWNPNGI